MESLRLSLDSIQLNEANDQVRILVDSKELRCSKLLLVQHFKYFEAYFAFSAPQDHQVVQLKGGIDYESIKTILDGLTSSSQTKGSIQIDEENVQSILQASAFLQCASAERASADFIIEKLSLSNAYSIFLLVTSMSFCPDFIQILSRFLKKNHFIQILSWFYPHFFPKIRIKSW